MMSVRPQSAVDDRDAIHLIAAVLVEAAEDRLREAPAAEDTHP